MNEVTVAAQRNVQATAEPASLLEQVVIHGDLGKLNSQQRVDYYRRVCESLGLNFLTKPFEYIKLNGKEVLYAKRDATDQLRRIYNVSISGIKTEQIKDVYVVTVNAEFGGRTDSATGAVATGSLTGDNLANALMKAETKAKRRVTLSICGLGWLDETELETIKDAKPAQGSIRDRVIGQVVLAQDSPNAAKVLRQVVVDNAPATLGKVHTPKTPQAETLECTTTPTVEEAGPLPASVPTSEPPQALPPPTADEKPWQKGIVTAITQNEKLTRAKKPWGTITLETIEGSTVEATWFGFSHPWSYETIKEQLCGTLLDVEYVLTPANDPKYKPTLEHIRVPQ